MKRRREEEDFSIFFITREGKAQCGAKLSPTTSKPIAGQPNRSPPPGLYGKACWGALSDPPHSRPGG